MASARAIAQAQAKRYFRSPRDQDIFLRQMADEAHFQDLTSPAGAQGPAQIMPATAASWGVHNVHDPTEAYAAAASHMADYLRQYGGSWRDALTAYNAGPGAVGKPLPAKTRNYIATILGGSGGATAGPVAAPTSRVTDTLQTGSALDAKAFKDAQRMTLLGQMLARRHGTDSPLFRSGVLSTTAPNPADFMRPTLTGSVTSSAAAALPAGAKGQVTVGPNAERPGAGLQPVLKDYIAAVAGRARRPIEITTGTNHNRMTVDGNVSDHWDGHAADIGVPVDSRQGDMIAAHALQEAGVPWRQAVTDAQKGGLYTLTPSSGPFAGRRVQVIWRTYQGGNHHNHVHVGVR